MNFTVAIIGCGKLASRFTPLFKAHPAVAGVALCDTRPERVADFAARFGVDRVFDDLDAVLASDIDAVAIFTQRSLHAPMALKALRAGKHVYCAVPAAVSVEEMQELVDTVRSTGLTYMLGETSYYYGTTVHCRERWQAGDFGRFIYGEGEYLHDMSHGFYDAYQYSGGPDWKRVAGIPPMFYPTHSTSIVLSVTGARVTSVSCLGIEDDHDDGVFGAGKNDWDNPFSNQTALMRTDDGGVLRVNEFRRVGHSRHRSVRLSLFGTQGSFEEQPGGAVFTTLDHQLEDQTAVVHCAGGEAPDPTPKPAPASPSADPGPPNLQAEFDSGFAPSHARERKRLPDTFKDMPNGHEGSHQFLVDDFCTALAAGALPRNHVWDAARYNLPGLLAHQSSLQGGKMLPVPDLGTPG